jgi:hypothetical protein
MLRVVKVVVEEEEVEALVVGPVVQVLAQPLEV